MRKKLTAALVVLAVLLAAAVGVVVYLESRSDIPAQPGNETTVPAEDTQTPVDTTAASENQETTEPEEETVAFSLPTEDPNEVLPQETFGEEDEVPPVTVDPDATQGTENREDNELELDKV